MTPLVFANIAAQAPMWSAIEPAIIDALMVRLRDEAHYRQVSNETRWASRDVRGAHDRFRRFYLGKGASLSLCRCMAHVEPHLHAPRKLRRIGHLPMLTLKELPE